MHLTEHIMRFNRRNDRPALARGVRTLEDIDCLTNPLREPFQGWDSGAGNSHIRVAEEYARGAFYVIVKFDRPAGSYAHNRNKFARASHEHLTLHFDSPSIWPDSGEFWDACCPQNWGDDNVLVRVVQNIEIVEVHSSTFDKGFRGFDGIFRPLTGCFYSIAGGFETDPSIACREFEVAILRAVINSDEFPNGVIQRGPQIVDSIAYYKGERGRNLFDKSDTDSKMAGVKVRLDDKSVRFFGNEGCELQFELRNVIIGPLKF
jgi:hypothetical protein